jgi:phytoene dehydrogenase-like protein
MATNFYDVIVIGNELGGLAAAALVARRGFRVLVLGEAAQAQSYHLGPFVLPRTPFPFVGLESPAVRRALGELGLAQILRRKLTALRPHYQVVLPKHRLDVCEDPDLNSRELEREFPRDLQAIAGITARAAALSGTLEAVLEQDVTLPPDGFWERREIGKLEAQLPPPEEDLLAPLPPGHPYRAVAAAPGWLAANFEARTLGAVGAARMGEVLRAGVWRLEGGRDTLRQLLVERIQTHSGEVRERATPEEVVVKRGRVAGVRILERNEELGCDHVIAALPAARLLSLLPDGKPPKALARATQAVTPAGFRYTLNLVLSVTGLPEALGGVVCSVADPAAPLTGDNALAIHVGDPDPEGRVVVSVQAVAPPEAENEPALLFDLRLAIRARLEEVLPFHAAHLLAVDSPHDDAPPEGQITTAVVRPPVPMDALWASTLPRCLGVGAVPHDAGIKHLYLCGRQNLPGLGLEGELASAWGCARLIAAGESRKDLLKREVLLSRG